jgi:6-phosphofructokinase
MTKTGNLIIGQSGGATAVINASLVGAFEEARDSERFDGIYGMHYGIEGLLGEDIIDLRRQSADLWSRLIDTPSAALGTCRYKLREDDPERVLALFRRYNIRYMLYIGGNDSADTAHRVALAAHRAGYELQAIGIPKTIDNDLPFTDHCPGYGSAARFLALATMDTAMNTISIPSHYPVKVIETMGRDAGWLAASTALGKRDEDDPPHIIYMPERPFNEERYLEQVETIYRRLGYVVVVVPEAMRDDKGQPLGSATQTGNDAFQHPLLSGAGQHLVNLVTQRLKLRARFDKPGDLQRMNSQSISCTDQQEAYLVGQVGTQALLSGAHDKMVTLVRRHESHYSCTTGLVDLAKIANEQRLMSSEYIDESKTMVTQAFYDYALPLIGDPLPQHAKIEVTRIQP